MSVQTSTANPAIGAPGMCSDDGFNDIVSKKATEAIPFGSYVVLSGDNCSLPDASGDVASGKGGIALHDPGKPTTDGYKAGDIVQVLRRGRAFVTNSTGTATAYGTVYVVHTTGAFRGTTDAGATALPGATYSRGGAGGALVEVELTMGAVGAAGATGATGPTGPTGPTGS